MGSPGWTGAAGRGRRCPNPSAAAPPSGTGGKGGEGALLWVGKRRMPPERVFSGLSATVFFRYFFDYMTPPLRRYVPRALGQSSNSYIIQRRAPPPTLPVAAPPRPEAATKGRRRAQ